MFIAVLLIAAAIAAGDQLFKYWIVANLELGGEIPLIPKIIHLTYAQNTGAAFSMLSGMRWVLLGITVVCLGLIIYYLIKMKISVFGNICAAMVIGGSIGNAIDRVVLGYVVDMFEVEFFDFAVFNIADSFVVVGCILFLIYYLINIKDIEPKKPSAKVVPKEEPKKDDLDDTVRIKLDNIEPSELESDDIDISKFMDNDKNDDEDEQYWTETKILESYDLERLLEEDRRNNGEG